MNRGCFLKIIPGSKQMVSLLPIYEVLKIETRIFAVSKHGIICLRFKSFETNIIFIHLHIFRFWILETNFIIIFHFLKSVFVEFKLNLIRTWSTKFWKGSTFNIFQVNKIFLTHIHPCMYATSPPILSKKTFFQNGWEFKRFENQ